MDTRYTFKKSSFFKPNQTATQLTEPASLTTEAQFGSPKLIVATLSALETDNQTQPSKNIQNSKQPGKFQHTKSRSEFSATIKGQSTAATLNSNLSPRKFVSNISDFYDANQIANCISKLRTRDERIKFLDHVIKRRQELKELEAKMKLEKALPMVSKFRNNMRRKTIMKFIPLNSENPDLRKVNSLRQGLTYQRDSVLMKIGSPSDFLLKEEKHEDDDSNSTFTDTRPSSPTRVGHSFNFPASSTSSMKPVGRENFAVAAFANFTKKLPSNLQLERSPSNSSNDAGFSPTGKIGEEEKELLENKVHQFSELLKAKIIENGFKKTDATAHENRIMQKLIRKPVKRWTPKIDNFSLAKKSLENDLYKFIVQNGAETNKDLLLKSNSIQDKNFHQVEEKVEKRLNTREQKNRLKSMLADTLPSQSPKAKTSLCFSGASLPEKSQFHSINLRSSPRVSIANIFSPKYGSVRSSRMTSPIKDDVFSPFSVRDMMASPIG